MRLPCHVGLFSQVIRVLKSARIEDHTVVKHQLPHRDAVSGLAESPLEDMIAEVERWRKQVILDAGDQRLCSSIHLSDEDDPTVRRKW
jgi:hypothetical protein